MLLQTTKRSPCGNLVARVVVDELWLGYSVMCYVQGTQDNSMHGLTRELALTYATNWVLQPVTLQQEPMALVPL